MLAGPPAVGARARDLGFRRIKTPKGYAGQRAYPSTSVRRVETP
jgi:hypothetical protein